MRKVVIIIILVFLFAITFNSCIKRSAKQTDFEENYYSGDISGNFKFIIEECAVFRSYCLLLFESRGIHFYILLNVEKSENLDYAFKFKKDEVYYLTLRSVAEYPDLISFYENMDQYYLGSELIWEDGKIYPKCYEIVDLGKPTEK